MEMPPKIPSSLARQLCLPFIALLSFPALLSAERVDVKTPDALQAVLESVKPGTTISLAAGEWRDLDVIISVEATAEQPVIIKAAAPGRAFLTGRTSIRLAGSHIILKDLHFRKARRADGREALITFRTGEGETASESRLTGIYFDHCNPPDPSENYPWIRMYGHRNRVDHCRFEGQNHKGRAIQVRVYDEDPAHLIDHNYFLNRPPGEESNGYEIIQIGLSHDSMKRGNVIVENNIFERCDGETEIISSKSFNNIIRDNLFLDSQGTVTLRHGNNSSVVGNAFIGNNRPGSGGVRVVGSGHEIRNNLFRGLTGRTGGVVVLYCGIPESPLNGYFAAHDTLLSENIFEGNTGNAVYLNGGFGQRNRIILPKNVRLESNTFRRPANGGTVAIAGWLEDLQLEGNIYESGLETGIHREEGLAPKKEVTVKALQVPDPDEVGPRWLVKVPELGLIQHGQLAELRDPKTAHAKSLRGFLNTRAEAILDAGRTYSVTFNDRIPPSGDKRDYYSTGPYWWPNPDTEDGLPYVRRDGQFNPERDRVSDRQPLHDMIRDVEILTVAGMVTGREAFRDFAADLLRVWFLDASTGMRPNLNHAQAIPGRTDGRGTGIIDTHPFAELVDALVLLEASGNLTPGEAGALRDWFEAFTDWLLSSANGRDERNSTNNHGTAYDLQAAALLWYTGQEQRLADYLSFVTLPRIDSQITEEGLQPHELARTRTWSYCTENLEHFFKLGLIAKQVNVDLFGYTSEEGATLWKALDYLVPYVCNKEAWPHPQETKWQDYFIRSVLSIALGEQARSHYRSALDCLEGEPTEDRLFAWLMKQSG